MKILVSGATGFIGNNVINFLLSKNIDVIATSRSEIKARKCEWYNSVNYIPFDISNISSIANIFTYFDKPDVLIHLAWDGLPNYNDSIHIDQNLYTHYNFIKKFIESGGTHVLITGTCLEYGQQSGSLEEEMHALPDCSYAIAKDSLRKFIFEFQKNKLKFTFQWLRLFYMYGEGQNSNALLPQLESAINKGDNVFNMSWGEQLRDYLPVNKVAEYISKVALQNEITGIINCCSGTPISVRKLVEDLIRRKNYNIKLNLGYYPYPNYEPMAFWGNNNKLKKTIKL